MWADPHLHSKFVHIYYSKSFTENLIVQFEDLISLYFTEAKEKETRIHKQV